MANKWEGFGGNPVIEINLRTSGKHQAGAGKVTPTEKPYKV